MFQTRTSKLILIARKCNNVKIVPKKAQLKTLQLTNSHSLAIFSSTVRLRDVIFSSLDLDMGVRVRLREESAYGRLKMWSFNKEIAGTAVWCPLTGGVR